MYKLSVGKAHTPAKWEPDSIVDGNVQPLWGKAHTPVKRGSNSIVEVFGVMFAHPLNGNRIQ